METKIIIIFSISIVAFVNQTGLFRHYNILEDFKTHHHNFAIFSQTVNANEKLLAAFNVQFKIGMNQSLI